MTIWTPKLSASGGPLYEALAQAIADGISDGTLQPGERLPTQRSLADRLGIALTTVTRGYVEAFRRGLVRGEVGRGTFVRGRSEGSKSDSTTLDLRPNSLLPLPFASELLAAMGRYLAAGDPAALMGYGSHRGAERHREAGARWMNKLGLETSADRVLVTNGAQHAMAVVLATIADPGDTVLVEEVTYAGMKSLANLLRLRLKALPLDDEGIRPDALRTALSAGGVRALYCIPTLQNPTSAVMSEPRRREIAAIAGEFGLPVVEDDSYGYLLPDLPRLSALLPSAYYIAGTSKSLLPAFRIGFVRAPAAMTERLEAAISATTYLASPLMADVVAQWIEDGTAQRIMNWKVREVAARQAIARRVFAAADYRAHPQSPHGWLTLPEPWTVRDFVTQAAMRGVHVSPADLFAVGRENVPHAVRIAIGPAQGQEELERGLGVLAGLSDEMPEAGAVVA